jgi:hypothetical protein
MRHTINGQVDPFLITLVGLESSLRHDPGRWDWPTETLDYVMFRLAQLSVDVVAGGAGTGVVG